MTNAERHQQLCRELSRLYERKNQGYGDSFHAGLTGCGKGTLARGKCG